MVTVKRLYLYGVLGVVGILLLVGLSDIVRVLVESLFGAAGTTLPPSYRTDREEVSLALALVLVGAPLWAVHAWLLRRSTHDSPEERADELASEARATYFLVALVVTVVVALSNAVDFLTQLFGAVTLGGQYRLYDMPGAIAGAAVFGSAWLAHLAWRRRDLWAEPDRTAADWSTRIYLYVVLFAAATLALLAGGECLTTVTREVAGMRPPFEGPRWWQEAIAGPLAMVIVGGLGWLFHMGVGSRLIHAPAPLGESHREARSRVAYFLGIVLLSAAVVLLSLTDGLRYAIAGVLDVWESVDGARFEEQVFGPILLVLPFVAAWWYHARRVSHEALEAGGSTRQIAVVRADRLLVAAIGLAGFSFGVAWSIGASIDLLGEFADSGVISASVLRDDAALGLAAALVGLVIWLPTWRLLRRERGLDPVGVAASTARRAYLLFVCGVGIVAAMVSLAFLVYQFMRVATEAGVADGSSWAVGGLLVAAIVVGYHLMAVRSDIAVVAAAEAVAPTEAVAPGTAIASGEAATQGATVEELEISGPAGADFEALNASIRSRLPEGYRLRVVSKVGGHQALGTRAGGH